MTSLLLTDRWLDDAALEQASFQVKSGGKPSVDEPERSELRDAARKAMALLGARDGGSDRLPQQGPWQGAKVRGVASASLKVAQASSRWSLSDILGGLVWMTLSGLLVLVLMYYTRNTVALISHGAETLGVVSSYDPHRCGSRKRKRTCHDHTISTKEFGAVSLDLQSEHQIGSKIFLTIEKGNNRNVRLGRAPALQTLTGVEYGAVVLLFLSLVFFVYSWSRAVGGLGITNSILKAAAYISTLGGVVGLYVWGIVGLFGASLDNLVVWPGGKQSEATRVAGPDRSLDYTKDDGRLPAGFILDPPEEDDVLPAESSFIPKNNEGGYTPPDFSDLAIDVEDAIPLPRPKPVQDHEAGAPPDTLELRPVLMSTGIIQRPSSPGVAPLQIKTRAGSNYFVKLVDPRNPKGRPRMTIFLNGGDSFRTKVPLGTYELRYALGQNWYGPGPLELFGPDTSVERADQLFTFSFDGQAYLGHSVELIPQANGNLPTTAFSPEDF